MSHDCFCIKHLLHQKRAIVLMSYLFLTTLLLCSEGNQKCSPDAGRLPCEETSLPTGKWQPIMLLTHWVGSRLYSRVQSASEPHMSQECSHLLDQFYPVLPCSSCMVWWFGDDTKQARLADWAVAQGDAPDDFWWTVFTSCLSCHLQ